MPKRFKLSVVAVLALLAGQVVPAVAQAGGQAPGANDPNPLVGQRWFVDWRDMPPAKAYRRYQHEGRQAEAALMHRIASKPMFRWITRYDPNPFTAAQRFFAYQTSADPGSVPGVTVFAHEGEKCGHGYGAGGKRADRRYRRWISRFARGVGNHRVILAYEPDSLGTLKCLTPSRRKSRLRNMRYGIRLLSKLPNATVYIEAGAMGWRPAREMVRYLRAVGVGRVRGFMLNVTQFQTTMHNVRYGLRISRALHGKHFVINTDENGNGPYLVRRRIGRRTKMQDVHPCNPKNSALGEAPTTATAHPKVDAYLWISKPGASAGTCQHADPRYSMRGGPTAGTFWPARALMLAARAHWS